MRRLSQFITTTKMTFLPLTSIEPGKISKYNECVSLGNGWLFSSKAIMDVWHVKTYVKATLHL